MVVKASAANYILDKEDIELVLFLTHQVALKKYWTYWRNPKPYAIDPNKLYYRIIYQYFIVK